MELHNFISYMINDYRHVYCFYVEKKGQWIKIDIRARSDHFYTRHCSVKSVSSPIRGLPLQI